jgi:FkbM family methyltransferase
MVDGATVPRTIDAYRIRLFTARVRRRLRETRRRVVTDAVTPHSHLPTHLISDRALLEAVSREHSRALYLGDRTVVCRVLGKYLVYADSQETGITPHLAMDGFWEPWITLALARTVRPGWHCLDVGANHGYYTLVLADGAGAEGRVVPIEPTPRLASLMRQTLDVNGFPTVEILEKAASDEDGRTLQLVIPAHRSLNAHLAETAAPTDEAVAVESVTIDAVTRDWPRVDLIKIDVEGAEESVWRGMTQTLAGNADLVVVLEFNAGRYADPRAFVETIQAAGFPLRHVEVDGSIGDVTVERLLTEHVGDDWMLYLARR